MGLSQGENLMADAIITLTAGSMRALLMVQRSDDGSWAVPGGHVDPGESGLHAALRELAEETGLEVPEEACTVMPARRVPDPRETPDAWAVTIPVRADLGIVRTLPEVRGADDAVRAEWVHAEDYGALCRHLALHGDRLFTAHEPMLREILGRQGPAEGRMIHDRTVASVDEAIGIVREALKVVSPWPERITVYPPDEDMTLRQPYTEGSRTPGYTLTRAQVAKMQEIRSAVRRQVSQEALAQVPDLLLASAEGAVISFWDETVRQVRG